jgi:hypothetical protein
MCNKPQRSERSECTDGDPRVARWFVFKPKLQIWVNFGGYCNGRCWYISWTFGLFTVFWYILLTFGIFCGNLVYFSSFGIFYQEKSGNPGGSTFSIGSLKIVLPDHKK